MCSAVDGIDAARAWGAVFAVQEGRDRRENIVELKSNDPYGRDKPSPLTNPTSSPSGEPVPGPDQEGIQIPSYLKPININTRDIEEVMRGHLNAVEPKMRRWLYSTWTADREAIKYQEIRNAIRDGEISADWLRQWQQSYTKLVNEKIAPQWEKTMLSASGALIEEAAEQGIKLEFGEQAYRVQNWIRQRGGELIVNLTESQFTAIRRTIEHYTIRDPIHSDELARLIRPMIGLTPKQSEYVRNYREKLVDQELSAKKIEHMVGNYAGRLHRVRAERIARTESAFAYNNGMLETMRHSQDEGLIRGTVVKVFHASKDERMCPHCGGLHNKKIGLEDTFPGVTKRIPTTYVPPVHPGCRCAVLFRVVPPQS
jgi:SPP1 gp7 family putative phage head morphogenesis protein